MGTEILISLKNGIYNSLIDIITSLHFIMDDSSVEYVCDSESNDTSTADLNDLEYSNFSFEQDHEYRMLCKTVEGNTTRDKEVTRQYSEMTKQYIEITKQKELEMNIMKLKLQTNINY